MAKKSKRRSKSKSSKATQSRLRGLITRWGGRAVIISAVVVGTAAAMKAMQKTVFRQRASLGAVRYQVELADVPAWMPGTLGRYILAGLTPRDVAFEAPDLCREVHRLARKSPWIAAVSEVRRVRLSANRGVVRVRAKYRQAVAKVSHQGRNWFVDAAGVVLPASQAPQWAAGVGGKLRYYVHRDAVPPNLRGMRVHYVVIEGVRSDPPGPGQKWNAADLAEGLRLVRLINTRKYVTQVTVVDVRNHARRISEAEPELRMYAQSGRGRPTDIRFGRFPHAGGGDWVVSPARKLKYLDEYVADQGGRLAGMHSYIDVRFDELRLSLN